jgi:alkanesulfonate monooxygenase SsuD/methylene tetrahydromethanopterin reductase-like flavin-dependent oxidoreductase (luciferase family)
MAGIVLCADHARAKRGSTALPTSSTARSGSAGHLHHYLRARLAIAGTPEACVAQVRAAEAAGVAQLMFTVSLAGYSQNLQGGLFRS